MWQKTNQKEILTVKNYHMAEGELPLLQFPLLEETGLVKHCFTTRAGGVSEGIFSTLNLSFSRGDQKEAVLENYRRLSQAIEVPMEQFVFSHQTHTTNVRRVTRADGGRGLTRPLEYQDVDGLITDEPGLLLATFYADCVPLFFLDPVHRAIGLSHSGWRGTVNRMGKVTLEAMENAFGSNPEEMLCCIGPSICQNCYEVDEIVAREFQKEFSNRIEDILMAGKEPGKYQLDLWKTNEIILQEAGVLPEHLSVTNICTCCNPKLLFSHRASKGKRGNLGAFLGLKEVE